MEQLQYYRQCLLERFESVAGKLEEVVQDIPEQDWHTPLGTGSWTPHQVLAHVRDAKAHEFLPCIESILDQDTPLMDCFDRDGWMAANYRPDEPVEAIWSELNSLHAEEYERFKGLSNADWSRRGRHPTWGLRTLQWWVEQGLAHMEGHLEQLKGDK